MTTAQIFSLIGIGLIAAGICGTLLVVMKRSKHAGARVEPGSGAAILALRSFARSNSFRLILPAHLEKNGRTANLDAIVVGYFGVLGVKSLPYDGEVYGSADEKEWLQVAPGGARNKFPNPMEEASADVRVIRDVLFTPKIKKVPVEVLCVFTAPKVQLALPRSVEYHTTKSLKKQLGMEKYLEDCGLDMDEVEKALRDALVRD